MSRYILREGQRGSEKIYFCSFRGNPKRERKKIDVNILTKMDHTARDRLTAGLLAFIDISGIEVTGGVKQNRKIEQPNSVFQYSYSIIRLKYTRNS